MNDQMSSEGSQRPPVLLLASASPRRRQLMAQLGLPFKVAVSPLDEEQLEASYKGPAEKLGRWLAEQKAEAALALPEAAGCLVVTADTTVILDGISQGKPRDAAHAREILRRLRGRWHQVITGVAVALPRSADETGKSGGHHDQRQALISSSQCVTPVLMRAYSDEEIETYIASGDPLDKAGAYGIQNPAFQLPERIAGCYLNVVGFPLCTLSTLLQAGGFSLPAHAQPLPGSRCPWSEHCLLSAGKSMI
ncbi:Maf family protein [Thermogemmatispora carboxidivorans]|uniref:Maf family protein n=1 Tax=Thermogemmatispora carboxidivorans TaxID=1382306 RepID=UPI00069BD6DB|nr:Maf family protein [Thermogemmatispora carboxidivorans]